MNWTPSHQSIALNEQEFSHQGPISTDPSHDLAHLIAGASGNLPWVPEGNNTATKIAEYNAILLEHLFTNTYDCIVTRSWSEDAALAKTKANARWFVEHHFAPFPITAEKALHEFLSLVDTQAILRLAPYFFRQKSAERSDPRFRERTWIVDVEVASTPQVDNPVEHRFVESVAQQIAKLRELSTQPTSPAYVSDPQQLFGT